VQQVLATYSEAMASVPALARQYHQRLTQLSNALPAAEDATAPVQPVSALLLTQLAKASSALYLLYKSVGALGLALGLPHGARPRAPALAEYNITAVDVQGLAASAAALNSRLALPALSQPSAPALLGELDCFLKRDLRAGILLLKDSQLAAYRALQAASQLPNPVPHQRRADRAHRTQKRIIARAPGGIMPSRFSYSVL
jgi:hypothetical protein